MDIQKEIKKIQRNLYVFGLWSYLPAGWKFRWHDFYWKWIGPIVKPQQKRYRGVIPKTWCDLTELVVIVNLEFIKGFYEDEFLKDSINWNSQEESKKFARWLKSAYKYVTVDRPKLEQDIDDAYPQDGEWANVFQKGSDDNGNTTWTLKGKTSPKNLYKQRYGKVDRLEKKLKEKDTKIITEMVQYREYFWT
jgi:hypothetical protein